MFQLTELGMINFVWFSKVDDYLAPFVLSLTKSEIELKRKSDVRPSKTEEIMMHDITTGLDWIRDVRFGALSLPATVLKTNQNL